MQRSRFLDRTAVGHPYVLEMVRRTVRCVFSIEQGIIWHKVSSHETSCAAVNAVTKAEGMGARGDLIVVLYL